MRIAILATGDEITEGHTLNTNTYEIARSLFSEGLEVGLHMACSDKETEILSCIQSLLNTHDGLITIGGLGPTSDDKTRFALAKAIDEPLISHSIALEHVNRYLKRAHLQMDSGNEQQTLFPKQAKLLPNPFGTALGCIFEHQTKWIALLPGPPRECLPMFKEHVLPDLERYGATNLARFQWLVFGLAEADIAARLDKAVAHLPCQTGYRVDVPYVECKVRCESQYAEEIKAVVNPLLQPYCLASPTQKASHLLKEALKTLPYSIYIEDHATGGLLQTLLLDPSTYTQVHFNAPLQAKLQFECSGLEAYWQQTKEDKTELRLTIKNEKNQKDENIILPYRTRHVVNMAAEWLCARILVSLP